MHAILSAFDETVLVTHPSQQPHTRSLQGRVALVTGSTRGIGAGIARVLAANGCDLVLNGRSPGEEIEALADDVRETCGVDVAYCAADLREAGQVLGLAAFAEERIGRVDILVNNAGIQHVAGIEDFADARWDEVIALNLSAAFRMIKAVLPGMRRRGWGRIINIASVHGLVASENKCAYVAAKHGLIGLTKVVALEAANDGVTCNAICPGWVLTELVQMQIEARARAGNVGIEQAGSDLLRAKQPMHQFSTAESIGAMTAFLCGDDARTITGAALTMDGGWTAA